MINLKNILKFVDLLNSFRQVTRVVYAHNEDRFENDVEHSYNLAMLAWYIIESHNLDLDKGLTLQYALVHDFVEIYAGDTFIYTKDVKELESKEARERDAAIRLQKEVGEFKDLHSLINRYEERVDNESRFVYALDKIQPVLQIYRDGGRLWREQGITIQMLVDSKKTKVALSPELVSCFNDLISILKKEEKTIFG